MASGFLMLPEVALNKGRGCAAGMGCTPWRSCILENESIIPWGPSQGRHRRLLSPLTWSCLLRSKRVEEEPKTVRDKSKVLVGWSPRCLKDAIYPELLLVVQA